MQFTLLMITFLATLNHSISTDELDLVPILQLPMYYQYLASKRVTGIKDTQRHYALITVFHDAGSTTTIPFMTCGVP